MSVAMTTDAVIERRKTVTRRKGLAPLSPETEAAREALHRAAWGGGER